MADLTRRDIAHRLERLADDLDQFPAGVLCPWDLARIANELIKAAKRDLPTDPIVRAIRMLEEVGEDERPAAAGTAVGTVAR